MSGAQVAGFCLGASGVMASGLLWLLLLRRRTNKVKRLRRLGHKTSGTVVDHLYWRSGDSTSGPYPMVQFRGPRGPVIAQSDVGGILVPRIGEQVPVLFDPDRPEKVYIEGRKSDLVFRIGWVIGWILTGGAVVAVVVVLLLYWSRW